MNIQFNTQVASCLSMHEAIFLGWLEHNYDQSPIQTEDLEQIFEFWKDETLYKVLIKLEERKILQIRRDKQHFCIFSIDPAKYQSETGLSIHTPAISTRAITDTNLKKHLQRFQSSENLLNKKLSTLVTEQSQELLEYAVSEGLPFDVASMSLDKFLHYVSANPDRFWNTDLVSYWRFWVSNNKERSHQSNLQKAGKRSAIEQSNQYAASNWLKKKAQSAELHSTVKISRK